MNVEPILSGGLGRPGTDQNEGGDPSPAIMAEPLLDRDGHGHVVAIACVSELLPSGLSLAHRVKYETGSSVTFRRMRAR